MNAPSSGSASGGPSAGYYADPSIPGYIRYWNGSAWVPGTSRPAPQEGEVLAPPPGVVVPPAATAGPSAPPVARVPAVDESGPVFLDEVPQSAPDSGSAVPPPSVPEPVSWPEPQSRPEEGTGAGQGLAQEAGRVPEQAEARTPGQAQEQLHGPPSGAAWGADASRQSGLDAGSGRVSWGAGAATAEPGPARQAAQPAPSAPSVPGAGAPHPGAPSAPVPGPHARAEPGSAPAAAGGPVQAAPAQSNPAPGAAPGPSAAVPHQAAGGHQPHGTGQGAPAPWPQQLQQLARQEPSPAERPVPWRPVAEDPFASAAEPARPAGLGRRLAARLLDLVLVGAVVGAVGTPLIMASIAHIEDKMRAAELTGQTVTVWLIDGTTGPYLGMLVAALLVTGLLYEALPTAKWGRTPGKKLFGLQVLDVESQMPPTLGRSLRRWLVHQLLGALVVGVLDAAWCLVDKPWRQCWHDKAGRTFVAADS
ncbi:RDD family protein [Streptomyces thermolineatus]|uniref:RDD family protein n=1 Tax=Streptomyces thermolineatus TaxID=44033 RepID=UPI003850BA6C